MQEQRYIEALPVGYQLESYRIEAVLGQGGFGITYCAQDLRVARRLALKEYFPAGSATRAQTLRVEPRGAALREEFGYGLQRFRREAEMLARFTHANIVRVSRLLDVNGTAYIVMSFEEGETLARLLERWPGGLPEPEIVRLFGGVVDGLELVHGTGHLHRDLAPDNIIIRRDQTPVIIDFGAARSAYGQRTRSMEAIIKAGYSPPEQYMLDHTQQGAWTDVYALGAIAYRCIGGPTPPGSLDRQSAIVNRHPDPLVPAAAIGRGRYSAALVGAIDRALLLSSRQRPAAVADWYASFVAPARTAIVPPPPAPEAAAPSRPGLLRRLFGRGRSEVTGAEPRSWCLAGTDSQGVTIQATISEEILRRCGGRLVIGRDKTQAQLTIADQTVSRRHAVLSLDEHGLLIADVESRNGTWVDGTRLGPSMPPVRVGPATRITLGQVEVVVSLG